MISIRELQPDDDLEVVLTLCKGFFVKQRRDSALHGAQHADDHDGRTGGHFFNRVVCDL